MSGLGKWWPSGRRPENPGGAGRAEGVDDPVTEPSGRVTEPSGRGGFFPLADERPDEADGPPSSVPAEPEPDGGRRRTGPWTGGFRALFSGGDRERPAEAGSSAAPAAPDDDGTLPPRYDPREPGARPAVRGERSDGGSTTRERSDGGSRRAGRAPVGWGSSRDVELGPPPPPDAPVNPGAPSGPIPVVGRGRAGWSAPSRSGSHADDDRVPAWARDPEPATPERGSPLAGPAEPDPRIERGTPPPRGGDGSTLDSSAFHDGARTGGALDDAELDGPRPAAPPWSRATPVADPFDAAVPPWRRPAVPGVAVAPRSPDPATGSSGDLPARPAPAAGPVTAAPTADESRPAAPLASNTAATGRAPHMSPPERPSTDARDRPGDPAPHADAPTALTPTGGRHAAPPDEAVGAGVAGPGAMPASPGPAPATAPGSPDPASSDTDPHDDLPPAPTPAEPRDAEDPATAPDDGPAADEPAIAAPTSSETGPDAPADALAGVPVATPERPSPPVGSATSAPPDDALASRPPSVAAARARLAQGRIGIDEVTPEVSGGRFPSKAVVGEVVPVTASVWREGHDAVAATLVWQRCADVDESDAHAVATAEPVGPEHAVRMVSLGKETDRAAAHLVPDAEGLWRFRVDAWSDPWGTWRHAVEVKVAAGQGPGELANDLETGARLLERAAGERGRDDHPRGGRSDGGWDDTAGLRDAAASLRDTGRGLPDRLAAALSEPVQRAMTLAPVRDLVTRGADHHVVVERDRALDGAWYEFFPRSTGGWDEDGKPVHGTFRTSFAQLERAAAMGFDIVYLPPIHPVGTVNRKGPNNTLTPGPDDVGSPWAIGSAAGGHDAIDPALGTIDDFDAFVARARELDLEVALDFALQCAPDHPWAATHPEWFTVRPDGTIAYAENPPKRYQDIYPVNFDTDPEGIYAESLRVVLYWLSHGVRIFRVDNPHTKPPDFWSWLIAQVHAVDPGVVFLAEAFTRPARLFGLAKAGFSQSYTYFTWRTGRDELREFFEMHRDRIDEARPNCFVNTPDILHESLQVGGPGMFAVRAALAATLSPSWGVYSGFELFEWQPVRPGSEEYLDSEKYQLRPRDFAGALAAGRSLEPFITRLNEIRRAHPALRQLRTLRFHEIDNPALLAFSKVDPLTGDTVIGVITTNPYGPEDGMLHLDMAALGLDPFARFGAFDEISGEVFDWGQTNYVRLDPGRDVAHVIAVRRR